VGATGHHDLTRLLAAATPEQIRGLKRLSPRSLGAVGPIEPEHANGRARVARFAFQYEHIVDAPASSGGIIQRVPLTTRASRIDPDTGLPVEEVETETA
jgi:hypothetical protein